MSKAEKEKLSEIYDILDKAITDRSSDMMMQFATAICEAKYKVLALKEGWDDKDI